MPLDWDHLRIFLGVARHGQLLAAARRLGLNHATVARRLDGLESELGVLLFDRRPAGTVLTPAGERLLPVAERIESDVLGIAENLRADEEDVSGTVRIGAPDGLGNYFLASELGSFAQNHRSLEIELVPLPRTFSLSRREADLSIVLEQPNEGRLVTSRLTDYTLGVYASRDYLERNGTPQSEDDLTEHSAVIGVEDLAYSTALDYSTVLERKCRIKFRCASVMGQMEAIKSGHGLGVLHDFAAVPEAAALVRILPDIRFKRSYFILGHPDTMSVRRVARTRDFIVKRFREERHRFVVQ